jgi:hypothetical protein
MVRLACSALAGAGCIVVMASGCGSHDSSEPTGAISSNLIVCDATPVLDAGV